MLVKVLAGRDELEEDAVVHVEQHAFHVGRILVRQEPFRGGVKLDARDLEPEQLLEPLGVGPVGDAPVDEQRQVGEDVLDGGRTSVLQQPLEVHLHPGRDAAHQPQILGAGLFHNGVHLRLPVFDAIGLPGGQPVPLQVGGHVVGDNAAEPSQMDASFRFRQFRAPLQKDHFPVHKRGVSGAGDVSQQRVARAADVVGHAVRRQRDELDAGRRAAGLAEIQGFPRPKDVLLARHSPVHIAFQAFVVPHGYALLKR